MRLLLLLIPVVCFAQNTQTGDLNTATIDSTVDSNNVTEAVTNNYNGAGSSSGLPANSAISPSYMVSGSESCVMSASGSVQSSIIGISAGRFFTDDKCTLRRNARVLYDFGMTVAAVALLCSDEEIWRAMFLAGTPCPVTIRGSLVVGRNNYLLLKQNPELIPDYAQYEAWYNMLLGLEEQTDNVEEVDNMSISERFRTSIRD